MKKILYILSMAVAIGFASCQKSEEQITPEVSGASEVVFTSDISTRATDTSWDDGDQIGVSMFEVSSTTFYSDSENVLYAISEVESGTFISSDPLIYPWTGENVDFFAYHPYTVDYSDYKVTLNTADQSSEAKVKAQDFMVARVQNCSAASAPSLSFSRKMSKILINVTLKESKENAILSDILLTNVVTDGDFLVLNGQENASVTVGETISDISLFFNETSSTIEAIVIPQNSSSVNLFLIIDGQYITTPLKESYEAGKQYSYTLTVGTDGVELSGATITSWDNEDNVDLSQTKLSYLASEISSANIPESDTWIITDNGEMSLELLDGVRSALYDLDDQAIGRKISLEFPNATSFGAYAFIELTALVSVDAPNLESIGDYAFALSGITSFDFAGVSKIGEGAFYYCQSLAEVANFDFATIPAYSFSNTALTSFDFTGVREIGFAAFAYCYSLVEVTNLSDVTIGMNAFISCSFSSVEFGGDVKIALQAFAQNFYITSIDFANVSELGEAAFSSCVLLSEVKNFGFSTVPGYAFLATALTSFDFTGVTEIGEQAFAYCQDITQIELPSTITSIGDYAFAESGVTSVTLNWTDDDDILTYNSTWFYAWDYELDQICYPLEKIYIPYGTTAAYVAKGWDENLLVEKEQ